MSTAARSGLTLALVAFTLPAAAAPAAKFKYPSGRVVYKLTSPMMNGTTTLSWIENGKKFRQDMKGRSPGNGMQIQTWALSDGAYVYSKQMSGNTVMRIKMPKEGHDMAASATPLIPSAKGKVVGKETILGKPCEIRQLNAAKLWVWQGVPLKLEAAQGARMSMVATKVEVGAKLDPKLFKIPAGYQIRDVQIPTGAPGKMAPGKMAPRK